MTEIRVGCSGFQKSHRVYYENYNLVEIQQTFYKPPKPETAQRWRAEAPGGFIFTIKAWQVITHEAYQPTYRRSRLKIGKQEMQQFGSFRWTDSVRDAWLVTREIAWLLEAPVILFQCPPQFTPTEEHVSNLREFMSRIDRGSFQLAWEPRGAWEDKQVLELCQELELTHAVDPFLNGAVWGKINYFRLHGGPDYTHQYREDELRWLTDQFQNPKPTYCLFNNLSMWEDGLRMKELLKKLPRFS